MDASELIPGAVIAFHSDRVFRNGKTMARVRSNFDDHVWLDSDQPLGIHFAAENCYLVQSDSLDSSVPKPDPDSAGGLLQEAAVLIGQRGKSRDDSGNERSMARTVAAFNAMTDHSLTEEDGWLFMRYLKDARSRKGEFNRDDYEDGIAYAALQAEAAINA